MQYINIKGIGKVNTQQGGRGHIMHTRTAWHAVLLLLSATALLLAGCPENPADQSDTTVDQSDTTAPEPITISNDNVTVSPSSVALQWEPSPSDDVAEIQITWTPTHGEEQPKIIAVGSTETTITGLNANTPYIFSITAIDTSDNASEVVEVPATTSLDSTTPEPVASLNAVPDSSGTAVMLTWDNSSSSDASTVRITWTATESDEEGNMEIQDGADMTTITGLTSETEYTFTLVVEDADNNSSTTDTATVTTLDITRPDPVTAVEATTTAGTTDVELSWGDSASNDATTIRITWNVSSTPTLLAGSRDIIHGTTNSTTIPGLNSEEEYEFTLIVLDDAVDALGNPNPNISDPATDTITTPDTNAPSSVQNLIATPLASYTEVELRWINPGGTDPNMLDITWRSSTNGVASGRKTIEAEMGPSVHTISELIPNTPYTFTITVIDIAKNRSPDKTVGPVTTLINTVDADDDTLIDIRSRVQLHNMRYNLAGTSYKTSSDDMGVLCGNDATTTCTGYELMQSVDFEQDSDNSTYNQATYALDPDDHHAIYFPITGGTGGWLPIGDATNPFSTIFEGNGFFIRDLAVRRNQTYIGMFGYADSSAIIRNIRLLNSLADYAGSADSITYIGNLVAYNEGTISASHVDLHPINGGPTDGGPADGGNGNNDRVGGLVGQNSGTIIASYATGTADGGNGIDDSIGGLVGVNSGTIIASYATGTADGGNGNLDDVGGLVGVNSGTIIASYATGNANEGDGIADYVGGLVGENSDTIIASYATGTANGGTGPSDVVGGLVGSSTGTITASYATGTANGGPGNSDSVGGLAGSSTGTITASYATGTANGGTGTSDTVGSLAGLSSGTLTASYGFGSRINREVNGVDDSGDRRSLANFAVGRGVDGARYWNATTSTSNRAAPAVFNMASSNTQNAWDFGDSTQAPALRYSDYDGTGGNTYGCGSSSTATIVIPDSVPNGSGGSTNVTCGATLLRGPQPR